MKYYWINIDKSTKRREFMEKQFKYLNIDNQRISAITPNDFDEILVQKRPLSCNYPGCITCEYEFACLCSHIKAMQEALKSNDPYFVIMEDDMFIPFVIDYDKFIQTIPKDADIIQMMILYANTVRTLYYNLYKKNVLFIKWQYLLPATGQYLISRQGAQKLVNMFYNKELNKYDFSNAKFQIVADVLLYSSVNTYATTYPFCHPHIPMGSEIHPDHLSAHADAVNGIKEVIDKDDENPFIIKKINETFYNNL
jgi:GR25 family glycosyltransferase involved in LPS biosynthesis